MSSKKQFKPPKQPLKPKYRAVVIGLGNIGFGYDLPDKSGQVFTHTKAYLTNSNVCLLAGIDLSESKRKEFFERTGIRAFGTLDDFQKANKQALDLVSICTPPQSHLKLVKQCLILKPRLIILEKPLAANLKEAREIVGLCQRKGTALYVNYIRRSDPFLQEVKKLIEKETLGKLVFGAVYYNRGVFNNASHFIDLLNFWFNEQLVGVGSVKNIKALTEPKDFNAHFELLYKIKGRVCPFSFKASDTIQYALSECDLFFTKGRIRFLDTDLRYEIYKSKKSAHFKGFSDIQRVKSGQVRGLLKYQANVLEHIIAYFNKKTKLNSTGKTGLKTLEIIEKIKDSRHVPNSHLLEGEEMILRSIRR